MKLLITIWILEHGLSISRGNLIGWSGSSRNIFFERGCPKDTVSWTPELVLCGGPVGHNEFDVDFAVYSRFVESKYWLQKFLFSGRYSKWGAIIHWTSQVFKDTMWCFLRLKKILYGQAEDALLWYEKFQHGLLDRSFLASKVDPWLFMSKTVICVVYVDDYLFWACSA